MSSPSAIEHAKQTADEWLRDLAQCDHDFDDRERGYAALRSVLHALRDRLILDEAAHLGAQLPTMIRGAYYGSWKPAKQPVKHKHKEEFFEGIRHELRDNIDPEKAVRAVFALLETKLPPGEIDDVRNMLPPELQELWPSSGKAH